MRQRREREPDPDIIAVLRIAGASLAIVIILVFSIFQIGWTTEKPILTSAVHARPRSGHVIMRATADDGTDLAVLPESMRRKGKEESTQARSTLDSSSSAFGSLFGNSAPPSPPEQPSAQTQPSSLSYAIRTDDETSSLAQYIKGKKAAENAGGYTPTPPEAMRSVPDAYVRRIPQWKQVLAKVADKDGVVVFATGTANYVDIMNSFFLTAIVPHQLYNFLFVAMGTGMCNSAEEEGTLHPAAHCVQYPRNIEGGGDWLNPNFAEVVQIKTDVLLGIVQEGYTALLSDADIHYLQSPTGPLAAKAKKYSADAVIQDDMEGGLNSGFMYFRPTTWANSYLGEVVAMERRNKALRQQEAVNTALKHFAGTDFRVLALPAKAWPCGIEYYQRQARRMYAWHAPCPGCIIVHNNYMLGDAGKEYRAKEFLQWGVDTAGGGDATAGYYSSGTTRYLVLGNPDPHISTRGEEVALKAAFKLAKILDRVVIIPWLRCRPHCVEINCQPRESRGDINICALNTRYYIRMWNQELGRLSWREQMFRYNPLTHESVRLRHNLIEWAFWAEGDPRVAPGWRDHSRPQSGLAAMETGLEGGKQVHYIATDAVPEPPSWGNKFGDEASRAQTKVHRMRRPGVVTPAEARELWGESTEKVLAFHSLYGVEVKWDTITGSETDFERRWQRSLRPSDLRQV